MSFALVFSCILLLVASLYFIMILAITIGALKKD